MHVSYKCNFQVINLLSHEPSVILYIYQQPDLYIDWVVEKSLIALKLKLH